MFIYIHILPYYCNWFPCALKVYLCYTVVEVLCMVGCLNFTLLQFLDLIFLNIYTVFIYCLPDGNPVFFMSQPLSGRDIYNCSVTHVRNSEIKQLRLLLFAMLWDIDLIFAMWVYNDKLQIKITFRSGPMIFGRVMALGLWNLVKYLVVTTYFRYVWRYWLGVWYMSV
jgi:hypothetical protein